MKKEMGGACSTYGGGRGEAYTGFCWGNLRETDHLADPGIDGRIILKSTFRKWDVGAWTGIELAQGMDRWRELVNAVMNFQIPQNTGNFLTS
jgi:hypothetical protein